MPLRESDIVPLLEKAPALGLKLGREGRDTLTVQPAERCPPDFADTLRAYMRRLLSLVELPFVMVYSKALQGTRGDRLLLPGRCHQSRADRSWR